MDFLSLKRAYLEKDLEAAITYTPELFLSELGQVSIHWVFRELKLGAHRREC